MRLVGTKHIFLTTKHRNDGSFYNPLFNLPSGGIEKKDGQIIRLSLIRWSCFLGWNNVNASNDTFAISDGTASTTIILTHGNYPYSKLAKYIMTAYPEVECTYNTISNKLEFQFTSPHSISFTNGSYNVLGFEEGSTYSTDASFFMTSTGILKGRSSDRIIVGIEGVTPQAGGNLENISEGMIRESSILAVVTLTASPFSYQNYINSTGEEMAMYISDKQINHIRLNLYDGGTGEIASFINIDSEFVLRVDVFDVSDNDHQNVTLSQIKEYLRLGFISQHLKKLPDELNNYI